FVLAMYRRGGDEGVDARTPRVSHRLTGAIDVELSGPGKTAHDRGLDALGDFRHGQEVSLAGNGKSGLDDVNTPGIKKIRNLELLFKGHRGAGALLTIA